jgi:hypothetical protein
MTSKASMTARRSASSVLLLQVLLTFLSGIIAVSTQQAFLEPARVNCNAAYSAPCCARTKAEYLVTLIAAYQSRGSDDFFGCISSGICR